MGHGQHGRTRVEGEAGVLDPPGATTRAIGALDDRHLESSATQVQGRRQAAEPGADDDGAAPGPVTMRVKC